MSSSHPIRPGLDVLDAKLDAIAENVGYIRDSVDSLNGRLRKVETDQARLEGTSGRWDMLLGLGTVVSGIVGSFLGPRQ